MADGLQPLRVCRAVVVMVLLVWSAVAQSREAAPLVADPALEARVMAVAEELRCLVCQNESIAASNAELAVDLRQQIRSQLSQGRTQAEILDYMTQRYGEFVRYRPPLRAGTVLLWLGPFVLLLWGAVLLWRQLRTLPETPQAPTWSEVERRRAQQMLEGPHP